MMRRPILPAAAVALLAAPLLTSCAPEGGADTAMTMDIRTVDAGA